MSGKDDRLFDAGGASGGAAKDAAQTASQTALANAIDFARARGIVAIPARYRGALGRGIKKLLEEGIEPGLVEAAAKHVLVYGLDPSLLAASVVTVQADSVGIRERVERDADRKLLDDFLAEHGGRWPTGFRMVRGTHGASYRPDPLGYDRPDYPFAGARVTRASVLAALKERNERAGPGDDPSPRGGGGAS